MRESRLLNTMMLIKTRAITDVWVLCILQYRMAQASLRMSAKVNIMIKNRILKFCGRIRYKDKRLAKLPKA